MPIASPGIRDGLSARGTRGRAKRRLALGLLAVVLLPAAWAASPGTLPATERPRARALGIEIGTLPTGPANAITDVPGVRVGQATLAEGDRIHTGVTAIVPHPGNPFRERVPAALYVGNGFGKLVGATQLRELGELETPILLTGTLSVWNAADALAAWMLALPGMEDVRSLNPVVGETNDGFLSDIRARPVTRELVFKALRDARPGPVLEGAIGAGAGTVAFGWKGGIGTSSRRLDIDGRTYTVGVLVQSNYGGRLTIGGVPVWKALPEPSRIAATAGAAATAPNSGDGSIMMIVATDAPMDARLLERLAKRAMLGLARTGSNMSNGSGDYVIAFSTAEEVRRRPEQPRQATVLLANEAMTPLFEAVADATEESILNSLFRAETVRGYRGTVPALPLDQVVEALRGR
ncbi:MAG TPA: aminopeptidase [Xanthomonadaceae bacterium]|nr:aminopeptidase [Xanthomonadaceae bacterium]